MYRQAEIKAAPAKFRTRREAEQAPRELVRPATGSSSSSVSERSDELGSRRLVRGSNSSETSTPQDLSSTSPAQERSDEPAPRRWCGSPSKTKNIKKNRNRDAKDRLRNLPEWLEELRENLEATEAPAPAHISQGSDSERPTKVARRKHSVENPLPKRPQLRRMP